MTKVKNIKVEEEYQSGYSYSLSEPEGKNFDPEFKPTLTPQQMLELGVFGGDYFNSPPSEFPSSWFSKAHLSNKGANKEINHYKVLASQPLSVWQAKGWINPEDPKGWFLWYCRYYLGRRIPDEDRRQIKRWKNINRHVQQLKKNCRPSDQSCRKRQRQALLHWAYDARKI
jgi:hypothetical protein